MKTHGGLYVTLFPDGKIRKEVIDDSGETVKFETSVTEDLLYYANVLYEPYENVMGYIKGLLEEKDTNHLEVSAKTFHLIINALCDITLGITPDIRYIKEYYFMEHVQIDGAECSRTYYFQMESGYMIFLLMRFMERKSLIARCQCCGRFFVPKTKKTTLYCDRLYLGENTCKEILHG